MLTNRFFFLVTAGIFFSRMLIAYQCCPKRVWDKYDQSRFAYKNESKAAFNRRNAATCMRTLMQKDHDIECEGNGDEKCVPYYAAQFSKTLEHDPVTGLLTESGQKSYELLVEGMKTGEQNIFNSIAQLPGAGKLVNPQGGLTFCLEGCDSASFNLKKFPRISSPEAACNFWFL